MNQSVLGLAKLSSELVTSRIMTDVSFAVVKKGMEQQEEAGNQMIRMMEQSVNPNLGLHVDVKL